MRTAAMLLMVFITFVAADPLVNSEGVGVRAYGMANNFTSLSNDFSSLFWNPAGMAFVPVREVHFTMDLNRQDMTGILRNDTASYELKSIRVSSGGLLRSLPTTRGGYAFAIGFLSPYILDDLSSYKGFDVYRGDLPRIGAADTLWPGDTLLLDRTDQVSTGRLYLWSAGMGWQIMPGLGFGFSYGLLMGSEKRNNDFASRLEQRPFEDISVSLERFYIGYDARVGLMYRPHPSVSLGCRAVLPHYAKVSENYEEVDLLIPENSYTLTSFGTLKSSFSGAFGAALQLPYATVSADATTRAPYWKATPQTDASYWKGGLGVGCEVPLPWIYSLLRGGYSYQQSDLSPMQITWDETGVDPEEKITVLRDRHLLTAGCSVIAGGGFSLDLAYGYQLWEFSSADPAWESIILERHHTQRVMASVAIRY